MVDLSKIRNIYLYSSLVLFTGAIDKLSNMRAKTEVKKDKVINEIEEKVKKER